MREKRKKSKNNKKLIFAIIGIIVLTCIIILFIIKKNSVNNNLQNENEGLALYNTTLGEEIKETEYGTKINTSMQINTDRTLDNLTITNIQLTYNSGVTSLTANITNNSNEATSIKTITASLVDEENKEFCRVKGVIRALGVGETGKLNISMSGNYITAYNINFLNN